MSIGILNTYRPVLKLGLIGGTFGSAYSLNSFRMAASAHEFDVVMNDGSSRSMSAYKGSPVIAVNVASK